jgi:arylsulfatase A-like enzyme
MRRSCSGPLLALVLTACGGAGERPNILLVTLDTTRADYLSCYGSVKARTPHMDALAAGGVRFADALSASAVTPVSHATILTGRYPYGHGLRVLHAASGYRLPERVPTLATILREEGWRTGAVHSAFPVSGTFGFQRDFDVFESFDGELAVGDGGPSRWSVSELQRRSDESVDRALRFVQGGPAPFFLWLHLWDPHDSLLLPPDPYLARVRKDPNGVHHPEELYAAELEYMDAQLGRLLDALPENTLVVLTSDHGEGLFDGLERHGWFNHRLLYQEQVHVPLIVRVPGDSGGRVVDDLVRTADIAPTVLDYAGVAGPRDLDGRSLRPLIEGGADAPRTAYGDQINGYDYNAGMVLRRPEAAFLFMVVDGDWKLIYRPHMPEASELYHRGRDPGEVTNVVAREPAIARRLLEDLAAREPWVLEAFPPAAGESGLDVGQALASLGYAGGEAHAGGDLTWEWRAISELGVPGLDAAVDGEARLPVTRWQ